MSNSVRNQYLALFWAIFILIMCDIPMHGERTPPFDGFDKLVHTGFFFVLTVLLFYGKIRQQRNYEYRIFTIMKIVAITAALGGGIEILQWKVFTYRDGDWWDFFCDMTGVGMGIFSYILLHRIKLHEKRVI